MLFVAPPLSAPAVMTVKCTAFSVLSRTHPYSALAMPHMSMMIVTQKLILAAFHPLGETGPQQGLMALIPLFSGTATIGRWRLVSRTQALLERH